MEKALALILGCECASDSGCPACIQHPDCNEYNAVLSKQSAVLVLQATLRAESEHRANAALQVSLPRCDIWSSIWACAKPTSTSWSEPVSASAGLAGMQGFTGPCSSPAATGPL